MELFDSESDRRVGTALLVLGGAQATAGAYRLGLFSGLFDGSEPAKAASLLRKGAHQTKKLGGKALKKTADVIEAGSEYHQAFRNVDSDQIIRAGQDTLKPGKSALRAQDISQVMKEAESQTLVRKRGWQHALLGLPEERVGIPRHGNAKFHTLITEETVKAGMSPHKIPVEGSGWTKPRAFMPLSDALAKTGQELPKTLIPEPPRKLAQVNRAIRARGIGGLQTMNPLAGKTTWVKSLKGVGVVGDVVSFGSELSEGDVTGAGAEVLDAAAYAIPVLGAINLAWTVGTTLGAWLDIIPDEYSGKGVAGTIETAITGD